MTGQLLQAHYNSRMRIRHLHRILVPVLALGFLLLQSPWLLAQEGTDPGEAPGHELDHLASPEFKIDDDLLRRISAEAAVAVGKEMGMALSDVPVRLVDRRELREVLEVELTSQFQAQFEDKEFARKQAQVQARTFSSALLAKFATETGEVLVCEKNFNALAEQLERPGLATAEGLRAVLCHELVHAADARVFRWQDVLNKLSTADATLALSALIEGHAQAVARRVCAKNGWIKDFELFTEMIGMTPPTGDPALDYIARVLTVNVSSAYYDGEVFVNALEKHGGAEAIARAFKAPPTEAVLILEPGWYLDPSSRPALGFDLDAALKAFGGEWDEETWSKQLVPMNRNQLQAALALLPKERVERALDHMLQCKVTVVTHKHEPPGTRMILAGLFEFDKPGAATQFLVLEENLMRKRDEAFANTAFKIESATYEQVTSGSIHGLFINKVLDLGEGVKFDTTVLVARRGRVVLELNYTGDKVDRKEALRMAKLLLRTEPLESKAIRKEKESAPAGGY